MVVLHLRMIFECKEKQVGNLYGLAFGMNKLELMINNDIKYISSANIEVIFYYNK